MWFLCAFFLAFVLCKFHSHYYVIVLFPVKSLSKCFLKYFFFRVRVTNDPFLTCGFVSLSMPSDAIIHKSNTLKYYESNALPSDNKQHVSVCRSLFFFSVPRLSLTVWWTLWRMCSTSWLSTYSSCSSLLWWPCSCSRDASFTALTNPKSLSAIAGQEKPNYTVPWVVKTFWSPSLYWVEATSSLSVSSPHAASSNHISGANIWCMKALTKWRRRSGSGRSTISTTTTWLGPYSPSSPCLPERGGRSESNFKHRQSHAAQIFSDSL